MWAILILLYLLYIPHKASAVIALSLGDALQRAENIDLQVVMANARLDQAIARKQEARAALLPQLDAMASGGRQTTDLRAGGIQIPLPGFASRVGPYNTFDGRLRASIDLLDPSAFARFAAAKKGVDLSKAQLTKIQEDILALVADLFIDAQRKEETVKLMKAIVDRDQMNYQLAQDNLNQGTGTDLDLNKLKSNLDQTTYLYHQARLQAKEALLDLEAALQIPLGESVVFLEDKDLIKIMQKNSGPNFDHFTNADMLVAQSQLEVNQANQKTAYMDLWPKVSGSASYGRSGESLNNASNVTSVGVSVAVPIWEGGKHQAAIKEAQGAVKEAEATLKDTRQQKELNVAKARAAILEAEYLRESKAQQKQTAQKSLLLALHSQEIGTASVFELMQAKANLAEAEDEYNEAEATWVMSYIDLFHAQGRLSDLIKQRGV